MNPASSIFGKLASIVLAVFIAVLFALPRRDSHTVAAPPSFPSDGGTPHHGVPLPCEVGPPDLKTLGVHDYLEARNLSLHVVSLRPYGGALEGGYYLCDRPRDWDSLCQSRFVQFADRWVGVVSVVQRDKGDQVTQIQEWGAHCLLTRHSVLFGDPQLLARIRKVLTE